ncbi:MULTISPECIES: exodeoxyribonuclease VII small subunit [Leptolyngbya]|jgi:exodeoxyribonuclease VII small subunit|uniref:Exodeoxyribonuclease 7 small subunit n=2 Tax=Leptolyngbya boryana TaxID=1184 RepID=A0A1Z4JL97_LEPBY|nr:MULTISPECIES: exodeoxyribonuclease VII small subunit [Leptolyngbya]BAY57539.1 exodeoxyribonuclease VII small subunit [Leptolyngbya boryana NIES-2135]MBD1859255.1 exodeoxyribonuclease VII small subunit [Leptolyngbya sp. FACHB-1624]MBD2368525.1 exodeoxyribonuclease VII small subunit [Leptolyngbya sp. FACHB-161]MBD2375214.1 exodeoxyribonuclease VII small subunit [Leptolyngbya sp. FACHB-238]MBD2399633.1 exodeoxyribonuclease VII small subunit [Leptolyngbya sp. FACHB-239]
MANSSRFNPSKTLNQLSTDTWNYEQTVARVEEILTRIESGELELAAVFEEFSTAVEYLRQCETFLAERQRQVDLLIETLTDEAEF